MENRSYALWVGLFSLLLIAAAVLGAVWLGRDKSARTLYDIYSTASVSGLSEQSAVRFQGVPVGRVQSLGLDLAKPGQVRIRIAVSRDTPITDATWAELGVQGITGAATVELRDEGKSATLLAASPGQPGVIPLRPGMFARLEERGDTLMRDLEAATVQVRALLSPENTQTLSVALKNAAQLSQQLQQAGAKIGPLLDKLGSAAQDASDTMHELRSAMSAISAPDGPFNAATQSIQDIARAAAQLNTQTLPAVTHMANNVNTAARKAAMTLYRVGDAPQSLLFGLPPAKPGPGEPGFGGFKP